MAKKRASATASEASKEQSPVEVAAAAPTEAEKSHHIVELFVENIMKVRVAHIRPKGNVVQLTGKNGQGKTSVLNAIAWALTGTGDIPSQPIRAGQRVGTIKMDLGDLVVTRNFTRIDPDRSEKGNTYITKLIVEGKNREQFRTPQAVLNALMGKISFDPLAFTRMEDKDQLETLRGLVKFDIDIDALDARQKADYEERKLAGREVDFRKPRLEAMAPPREGLPEKPIDIAEITKRLEGAANHNSVVAAKRQEKARLEEQLTEAREKAVALRNEGIRLIEEAESVDGWKYTISRFGGYPIGGEVARLEALSANVVVPEEVFTSDIVADLGAANATNQAIAHAAAYKVVADELKAAEEEWETLDAAIKARGKERAGAIARAKMPIDGLSIGDGEVLYRDLPFRQASNAEQIRVSMALAMASNPKLRVLRIADGSLLDSESLTLISVEADKNGFQVWIERVDTGGAVGVLMEEGEASGDEVVDPKKAAK